MMQVRIHDDGRATAHDYGFKSQLAPASCGVAIHATRNGARMHEMFLQMWNVFQKNDVVAHRHMIKQHEMLVQLPHVSDMRHDRHTGFTAQQAYRDKFADAPPLGRRPLE